MLKSGGSWPSSAWTGSTWMAQAEVFAFSAADPRSTSPGVRAHNSNACPAIRTSVTGSNVRFDFIAWYLRYLASPAGWLPGWKRARPAPQVAFSRPPPGPAARHGEHDSMESAVGVTIPVSYTHLR